MAVKRDKPELLAPAGDMERLKMAVLYGADAVYLAGTSFGMRAFAGNFSDEELPQAVAFAHSHGVRVHCTINTMPRNDEAARLPEHLERLADAGVDALIVADLGAFTMAGKYAPRCERHISTQASICNYETARAWHDLGASRVILARELTLEEIASVAAAPFWSTIDRKPAAERARLTYLRNMFSSMLVTGPFSILLGFEGGLMALNDRLKLRSMVAAEKGERFYAASEEAAIRRIEPALERVWAPRGGEPVLVGLQQER